MDGVSSVNPYANIPIAFSFVLASVLVLLCFVISLKKMRAWGEVIRQYWWALKAKRQENFLPEFSVRAVFRRRALLSVSLGVILTSKLELGIKIPVLFKLIEEDASSSSVWMLIIITLTYLFGRFLLEVVYTLINAFHAVAKQGAWMAVDSEPWDDFFAYEDEQEKVEAQADDPKLYRLWETRRANMNSVAKKIQYWAEWWGGLYIPLVLGFWAICISASKIS